MRSQGITNVNRIHPLWTTTRCGLVYLTFWSQFCLYLLLAFMIFHQCFMYTTYEGLWRHKKSSEKVNLPQNCCPGWSKLLLLIYQKVIITLLSISFPHKTRTCVRAPMLYMLLQSWYIWQLFAQIYARPWCKRFTFHTGRGGTRTGGLAFSQIHH